MSDVLAELADYLKQHQEEIVDRWCKACLKDKDLQIVGRLTRNEFRNSIPVALADLYEMLRGGALPDPDQVEQDVAVHGHHRWKQGFSLRELVHDWGNLNRVLVATVHEYFLSLEIHDEVGLGKALDCVAEFATEAMNASVSRYDELRRAEAASTGRDLQLARDRFERLTAARGQLLREATHDIRGGLTAIAGASDVLKLSKEADDSLSAVLDSLDEGIASVKEMLDSLLDLARLEAGAEKMELVNVDVGDLMTRLAHEYESLARAKGLELMTLGPEQLVVETDLDKVRRITQNLLLNAIQHTTSGCVRLRWEEQSAKWLLRIEDTGPGLQDEMGSVIAQELNTPTPEGAGSDLQEPYAHHGEGIGLTIVKRLCGMLDAGLSLASELGKGAVFTVEFPLTYE